MLDRIIRAAVRTRFALTTRERATRTIVQQRARYLALAGRLDADAGSRPVTVPAMPGVDPEMRHWSFHQLLEHHAIVHRSMTDIVGSLARGEMPQGAGTIDPKLGVLPAADSGPDQVGAFAASVDDYLAVVAAIDRLRGTREMEHPVFGSFDVHRWHCMLGFHLQIHWRQAKLIADHEMS